ncbi:MAG: hypothetical protein CMF69_01775 [Magnetovibrio sp.]|nr:hypothetical protein [Magnetovibrio sp.]|tara:strand:+ start:2732 stop:3352 length:621 start_codon:yes stop_codon:yes gene_type:complete
MDLLQLLLNFNFEAFTKVVLIDLVMSGDNAIIIGMAAAGLPIKLRRRAIFIGIVAATVLRIVFASVTYQLLEITGLTLIGGLLLVWVAFKLWQDIRSGALTNADDSPHNKETSKTLKSAVTSIIIADVTMSLDNVLAVAGAAHGAPGMLIFGLVLSILLMAFAANWVASLLERYNWLAYLGAGVVSYVALEMIWRGGNQIYASGLI